jgi:hypothetical protein
MNDKDVIAQSAAGVEPIRVLLDKDKYVSCVRLANLDGMVPVSALLNNHKDVSCVRLANSDGMVLVSALAPKDKYASCVRLANSDGMVPVTEGYPPCFVRVRDSLRTYISTLFQSQIVFIRWCDVYDDSKQCQSEQKLEEEEFRGDRLMKNWTCYVKGNNNDMLSISPPQVIQNIYRQYFGNCWIEYRWYEYLFFHHDCDGRLRYATVSYAYYEMNYVSARLARAVCDEVTARDL